MKRTVAEILDWLEKPGNEEYFEHLAELENLKELGKVRQTRGFIGMILNLVLRTTASHLEALIALSECKNAADVAAFKQTKHYNKIKHFQVQLGDKWDDLMS